MVSFLDQVWDIFLYLHLGNINPEERDALMKAHREGDFNTKLALHEKYFSATSAAMLEHVDSILEEIDKVITKSDAHEIYIRNEHRRLPLIHRHNDFVRETFANVKSRYSPEPSYPAADWQQDAYNYYPENSSALSP